MPNMVKNILRLTALNNQSYNQAIKDLIQNHYDGNGILHRQTLCFDKILPQPRVKSECPKEYITDPDAPDDSDDEGARTKWFNWYDWRLDNWGTKWDACDCEIKYKDTSIVFIFQTAWNYPEGIMQALANMGYYFDWLYADEETSSNNYGEIICQQPTYPSDVRKITNINSWDLSDSFPDEVWAMDE